MNKNLLTYNSKVVKVEQDYYSPTAIIPTNSSTVNTLYAFLSKVDPWTSDSNPDQPTQDQRYIKNVFKNIFVAKRIDSTAISPVIQRIDWTNGTTYQYYQDNIDMFATTNGLLVNNFYVRNRYNQVFKCLWNNNNQPSVNEPFFQPGSYGTNNIFTGQDGYQWKYMYTIDIGSKVNFMDSSWMPVPIGSNIPNALSTSAGFGDIESIGVLNGGTGYDSVNSFITVVITGDGYGATASATAANGAIQSIQIANTGYNYTFANTTVTSTLGSGATFVSCASPIGGHGFDPISELGCNHVMISTEFNGSENGIIPTDIDYRQLGILVNPTALSTYPNKANGVIYKTTTDVTVASGFGSYNSDEIVFQGSTLATASFSATVLSFDPTTNTVKLINIQGTPTTNASLFGNTSKTARTLLAISYPDFQTFSGYLAYIENRSGVQRSADGIEQIRLILQY